MFLVVAMNITSLYLPYNTAETKADGTSSFDGAKVKNVNNLTDTSEYAIIQGDGASVVYDTVLGSNVLKLEGGSFGAGWLQLPANLYKGVQDGFSIAMKVKLDESATDYMKLFQSTSIDFGSGSTWWWDAPDLSVDTGSQNGWRNTIYLGKTENTIDDNGIYRCSFNSSISPVKGEWTDVVVTISKTGYGFYINGNKIATTVSDENLNKILTTLFDEEADYLSAYINNAIGHSVYESDADIKASVDNVTFYNYELSEVQAASLPADAAYKWTFDEGTVVLDEAESNNIYYNNAKIYNAVTGIEDTGTAIIKGEGVSIVEDDATGNKVLNLPGGSFGSGWLQLPESLYSNVTDGFTISLKVKLASNAKNYERIFESSSMDFGSTGAGWDYPEFAFVGANDGVWSGMLWVTSGNVPYVKWPALTKNVWSTVTVSVTKTTYEVYINGVKQTVTNDGNFSQLAALFTKLADYKYNSIGHSIYGTDPDLKGQVDDVTFYSRALTSAEATAATLPSDAAYIWDFEDENFKPGTPEEENGSDTEYTDGTALTAVSDLAVASPNGKVTAKVMKDEQGRFFYTSSHNGTVVLQASKLGLKTGSSDLTTGLSYTAGTATTEYVNDSYELITGSSSTASDEYNELKFELKDTANNSVYIYIRAYDDGIAYRYEMLGTVGTTEKVNSEASEFVLPTAQTTVWAGSPNNTYEFEFTKRSMASVKNSTQDLSTPLLASVNNGNQWVLLTEGNVFNEADPYCASYFTTTNGERNIKMKFGNKQTSALTMSYLKDENNNYSWHTPWRVAIITDNLNDLTISTLVSDVNPKSVIADTSWIKTGKVAWSWWSSSGDDPIKYDVQKDYIDFAADNGWDYVCLDYGWCLWENYSEKIADLVQYAEAKGVSIMLWYGVNNTGHTAAGAYPKYSLLTEAKIKEQFEWAHSIGVKGVKVDYYESDTQTTMKQMYLCADIAARNEIAVLFHGNTMPGGEERTYPNILSYEAVYGAEYYKWRAEPTVENCLTYLFTRNVAGSMDFTPPATQVANINATAGFQLAETVVFESGLQHFAQSIYVYEDYAALPFLNDVSVTWDESKLLDGYPGEYNAVARKSGDDWYIGAMSLDSRDVSYALDFLEAGEAYTAYIFKDNANGTDIELEQILVTSDSTLNYSLLANGGLAVKISKNEMKLSTVYDDYTYYQAESGTLLGAVTIATNQFASGMKQVGNIRNGSSNSVKLTVNAATAGVYEMKLFYVSGADNRICYSINGAERIRSGILNSGDSVTVAMEKFYVTLKAGSNTIELYNQGTKTLSVDRVALSNTSTSQQPTATDETDDGGSSKDGAQYDYTEYKAINATVVGAIKETAGYVGWLGGANSYISFTVNVETAGTYKMQLNYFTGTSRNVVVTTNGGTSVTYSCDATGGWTIDNMDAMYMDVILTAGKNTIKLANPSGDCPNIYSIGISKTIIKTADKVAVTGVTLNKKATTLVVGDSLTLKATVTPANASNKDYTWKSSNPSAATVSNGKVTAKAAGESTITVTTKDGSIKAQCVITVKAKTKSITVKAKGYTLKNNRINLVKGKSVTLKSVIAPATATKGVTYKVTKGTKYVKVTQAGKVTAKAAGTAKVTITSKDKLKNKVITVVVTKKAMANTKLTVKNMTVKKGQTKKINVSVLAKTTQMLTYKVIKGSKYAKVDQYGIVTGMKKGKATIKLTCGSKTKSIIVTVK